MDVIWVYLSGKKNAHSSFRFESLSKAESSVARLVLVIPHSNGGEFKTGFFFSLIDQVLIQMEPCHLRDWQTLIPEHALNGHLHFNIKS